VGGIAKKTLGYSLVQISTVPQKKNQGRGYDWNSGGQYMRRNVDTLPSLSKITSPEKGPTASKDFSLGEEEGKNAFLWTFKTSSSPIALSGCAIIEGEVKKVSWEIRKGSVVCRKQFLALLPKKK